MNLADMMTMITLFGCPAAAGLIASSEKAGWLSILFICFGALIGFAGSYGVKSLSYLILFSGCKQSRGWASGLLFVEYMFIPMIVACGAIGLTATLTGWLVRHIL